MADKDKDEAAREREKKATAARAEATKQTGPQAEYPEPEREGPEKGKDGAPNTVGGVVRSPADQKALDELKAVAAADGLTTARGRAAAEEIARLTGSTARPGVEKDEKGQIRLPGETISEEEAAELPVIVANQYDVPGDEDEDGYTMPRTIPPLTPVDEADLDEEQFRFGVERGVIRRATPAEASQIKLRKAEGATSSGLTERRMKELGGVRARRKKAAGEKEDAKERAATRSKAGKK